MLSSSSASMPERCSTASRTSSGGAVRDNSRRSSSSATNSLMPFTARVEMPGASSAQGLAERDAIACGQCLDAGLGAIADAAARGVQDAADADRVVVVGDRPQVAERVADLLALVEAHAADHFVRQADTD